MNPPLQTYPDLFNLQIHHLNQPSSRGRIVTLPWTVIALILAIGLVCGCAKENEDLC